MLTVDYLYQTLTNLTRKYHFCVALSGGLDSQVLLHAMHVLVQQHPEISLRAMHIHHGLNPDADAWEAHCRASCAALGVAFSSERVQLDLHSGESVEAMARAARYRLFEQHLQPGETLLTAHHKNDQAETLLLQLMRGAGVKGLASMPEKKPLARGFLLRPLLTFTRENLHAYAKAHQLSWVEDDSNASLRFDRNYLRHKVMPALQTRWPEMLTTLTRSGAHCAESSDLLDQLADIDLKTIEGDTNNILLVAPLQQLPQARQRNVLRRWIASHGYRLPSAKQLAQIFQTILSAAEDAVPRVCWDQVEVRRFQNQLYLLPASAQHDITRVVTWNLAQPLVLPGIGQLVTQAIKGQGLSNALNFKEVTIRFRQGGERCCPVGRKQTHTLKNLLQEWRIPPWQRDRIPLVYYKEELAAVVGYCVCQGYAANQNETGMTIQWVSKHN